MWEWCNGEILQVALTELQICLRVFSAQICADAVVPSYTHALAPQPWLCFYQLHPINKLPHGPLLERSLTLQEKPHKHSTVTQVISDLTSQKTTEQSLSQLRLVDPSFGKAWTTPVYP